MGSAGHRHGFGFGFGFGFGVGVGVFTLEQVIIRRSNSVAASVGHHQSKGASQL